MVSESTEQALLPISFAQPLEPAHASEEMKKALWFRRSTQADMLGDPGPDEATLQTILTIAARVPDHRKIVPFRFIVFSGQAREQAGHILATQFSKITPEATPERLVQEQGRFMRAPVIVAVISSPNYEHRTPVWEQTLCVGAVCQNMLLAASAHGFAAQWLTEWYAYDEDVMTKFGVGAGEKIAGYIYIGKATAPPKERQRPDMSALISTFAS